MKHKSISQEGLKIIACLTMLIDHFGATIVYSTYLDALTAGDPAAVNALVTVYYALRIIGRIAFPIYCFQLVEGFHYTRDRRKYVNRLAVGLLLSELPFDLALNGMAVDWSSNSVMITLLLGVLLMTGMECFPGWWKLLAIPPFYGIAEFLGCDYGGHGILLIAMLYLTRGIPHESLWRAAGFAVLLWFGARIQIGPVRVPIEIFGLLALIPICLHDGRKLTRNKWVQWGFYLFYPVHLLILWGLERLLFQ